MQCTRSLHSLHSGILSFFARVAAGTAALSDTPGTSGAHHIVDALPLEQGTIERRSRRVPS